MRNDAIEADYIIIGAGSAGSALAYRLSEDGKHKVIIIEYGGSDRGPFIQMPAALSFPMNMSYYDWGYKTEPEQHLNGRRLATPRGKVIGGSSSINGMVYVRGHACDFDHWAEMGAKGWDYAHVLPYFKRMENWSSNGHGGDASWRGTSGPLYVSRGPRSNPLYHAFVEAGKQAGYQATDDYNGEKQEGFGPMDATIHKGRRWSTANAYLKPALKRKNVTLIKGLAHRILFQGKRATGVLIETASKMRTIKAHKSVILSAGAINSPKILMQSGVGDAEHLKAHNIPIVANRKGVGQNLQDHLELYIQKFCLQPISLSQYWNPLSKALIGAQWLFTKTGLGASNHFESAAFIRSKAGVRYPDVQYHFLPIAVRYDGKVTTKQHGFQAHVGPMRSQSRGEVTLASADPRIPPKIHFNYMSHEEDWADFRLAIRLTREIFNQEAFKPYAGDEIQLKNITSDDALNEFIKNHAESAYHPCGTCKMGAQSDALAVVDEKVNVIGVEGLHLADSSIFPRITNGNLNAPSIMVGERAADLILNKPPLAPQHSPPWIHPNWENKQR